MRGETLAAREMEYVEAARAIGVAPLGIMLREILPNILSPVIVVATFRHGARDHPRGQPVVPRPRRAAADASWGSMVADGREFMLDAWWVSTFAGLAILIAGARDQRREPGPARRLRSTLPRLSGRPTRAAGRPTLLAIRGLSTAFATRSGLVTAVDGVDLDVRPGECLGVVGESGSGKSVTFSAVMGLVRRPGRVAAGSIRFRDRDLLALGDAERRALRGRDIAMTMQDALTALNPAFTVATQITEVLLAHRRVGSRAEARREALELMRLGRHPRARSSGSTTIRTSSPAACASAS